MRIVPPHPSFYPLPPTQVSPQRASLLASSLDFRWIHAVRAPWAERSSLATKLWPPDWGIGRCSSAISGRASCGCAIARRPTDPTAVRRLIAPESVTLDGVMDAPGTSPVRTGKNAWALRHAGEDQQRYKVGEVGATPKSEDPALLPCRGGSRDRIPSSAPGQRGSPATRGDSRCLDPGPVEDPFALHAAQECPEAGHALGSQNPGRTNALPPALSLGLRR